MTDISHPLKPKPDRPIEPLTLLVIGEVQQWRTWMLNPPIKSTSLAKVAKELEAALAGSRGRSV